MLGTGASLNSGELGVTLTEEYIATSPEISNIPLSPEVQSCLPLHSDLEQDGYVWMQVWTLMLRLQMKDLLKLMSHHFKRLAMVIFHWELFKRIQKAVISSLFPQQHWRK